MSRFIKFFPSEKSEWLAIKHPNAFILLCIIATRARRTPNSPDGLDIGEAHIGDWESYGMSEQNYRTAKNVLCKAGILRILETNRSRKKSTTGSTTKGTKVKLLDSSIWDINSEDPNDRANDCLTTDQRLANDVKECKNDKNDKNKDIANDASLLGKNKSIFFSFESRNFQNILEKDLADWKELFPAVDIPLEIKRMCDWCLGNPSKAKSKKNWRAFISKWLRRSNEDSINKQAYKSRFTQTTDRSTKDKSGNVVPSYAEERNLF